LTPRYGLPGAMKRIVITGCTRGLGRALVAEFAALGHTIIGCGRSGEAVLDLRFAYPAPHSFDVVDVALATKVALWAERVLGTHGAPDLLINNAAVMNAPAPLWQVPAAEFDRMVAVNISGMANVIRCFVPAMVERGAGVIVNLSSGWGRTVSAEVAPYCATKWAVEGLTRALAEELPAGLAAVPLNPGVIDTDMLRRCWGDDAGSYPKAATWAKIAAPFLLQLSAKDNGRSLSVPEVEA
jgi:NAD(P)-dependent dehydrogenase (short-subunit alcohol dehydrogenase family)